MEAFKQTTGTTNPWRFAAFIGIYAGLIWGGLRYIQHYFQLTSVSPAFLLKPFLRSRILGTWYGSLSGWLTFVALSVVAALIYAAMLRKRKGPWWGIGYGVVWWMALYLLIGPAAGMMRRIGVLEWNSAITDFCLFAVWGLFIGYSISYEFTDERLREPEGGSILQPT